MESENCDSLMVESTEKMFDIPPLFRLPRAVIVNVLEFLVMEDLGRMDSAVTMKETGIRPQFLLCLSEMRSSAIRSVSVSAELANDERVLHRGSGVFFRSNNGKFANSYLQMVRLHWLTLRQLYVEKLRVACQMVSLHNHHSSKMKLCDFLQVTKFPSLRHLVLQGKFRNDELSNLINNSQALQSISFKPQNYQRPNISVEDCHSIAEFCPALEKIDISEGTIAAEGLLEVLYRCSHMKTISLRHTSLRNFSIEDMIHLGAYGHVFDTLMLTNKFLPAATVSTFLSGCTSLRRLIYNGAGIDEPDEIVLPDPTKCPLLEDLTLECLAGSVGSYLQLTVLQRFTNLRWLEFVRCNLIFASAAPILLIRQLATLETLELTNCHLNDEAFDKLVNGSLNRLRCLIIIDNFGNTILSATAFKLLSTGSFHDTIEEVLIFGRHLESISLTLNDLRQLSSSCRHLTCLPLSWKNGLEPSEVALFATEFPLLKFSDEYTKISSRRG